MGRVMSSTVMVVGNGGREHALAWALAKSPQVDDVVVVPGNPGTANEPGCRNLPIAVSDLDAIVAAAVDHQVRLVVVGPEDPLVAGLVDRLEQAGVAAFGPSEAAAQLEGSKAHCKAFLLRHQIPTGAAATFRSADEALAYLAGCDEVPVVKASGLAAGKGVIVADTMAEAQAAVVSILVDGRFGSAGAEVLLEERLHGPEVSVLGFCDGEQFSIMPAAQDHKRLRNGDQGPNTGGMGAFHPSPVADQELLEQVAREVFEPTLAGMAAEGRPYRGVLYAGMMLTSDGPKVIEFNCRFGDPETQVVLPLLESDLLEIFEACRNGELATVTPVWRNEAAVTVVLASAGYPETKSEPVPIVGIDAAEQQGTKVFHAGTGLDDTREVVMATGGRVLAVTAVAPSLAQAAEAAHAGADRIQFDGAQRRTDVARETAKVKQ